MSAPTPTPPAPGDAEHAPATILVVDDDRDTRVVICRMIAPLGANIVEAATGRQALSLIKKQRFDVVISDLVMPRMSGMLLLHSLLEQGLCMPFILVTGYSDTDSAVQALRLGAFDYLEKPIDATDLRSVVTEALKVSAEQQAMVHTLRTQHVGTERGDNLKMAEVQVMRMRALRFRREAFDSPVALGNDLSWQELKDAFVLESEPQLVFCGAALKALITVEAQDAQDSARVATQDLGFVVRVAQSIRMTAEALRLNDIATLAWSLESSLAACKSRPASIRAAHVVMLREACALLQRQIAALGDPEAARVRAGLDAFAAELRQDDGTPVDRKASA